MHLTGPSSPKSTTGGEYSWSIGRAIGLMTRPNGTAVCFIMSEVVGTLYIVDLMYLGLTLPWSCVMNCVDTRGGTRPF